MLCVPLFVLRVLLCKCFNGLRLNQAGASEGSGYGGRRSPHTENELFEGLTVEEAAKVRIANPSPNTEQYDQDVC